MFNKKRQKKAIRLEKESRLTMNFRGRRLILLGLFIFAAIALVFTSVKHQIFEKNFLQHEGERRHLRNVVIPAHRGRILDKDGQILAASTPVSTVWANPKKLVLDYKQRRELAKLMGWNSAKLASKLRNQKKSFVYLAKRISPEQAANIKAFIRDKKNKLRGIGLEPAYRRYYPDGEVFAHILGFTNVDDKGIEGVEKVKNDILKGQAGKKRVIKNGRGQIVKEVEIMYPAELGGDVQLTLDRRLQYLAYRSLKKMMEKHRAKAASAVLLDVKTGEILALVNQPSYNPNGLKSSTDAMRNRAVTDSFEPGSTFKPLTIATGLESGEYQPQSKVNTNPGYFMLGRYKVSDHNPLGIIDLTTIIQKSSNVGAAKVALSLPAETLWQSLKNFGIGEMAKSGILGESHGRLRHYESWAKIDQASISYGYSVAVTTLQLAKAYAVFATDGLNKNYTIYQNHKSTKAAPRVLKESTAKAVRLMMETVTQKGGTATQAAIDSYRVAGKTGTSKIRSKSGGYGGRRYYAVFAGMAPVSDPRFVMVVAVREPRAGQYYGGQVAAPVFAEVMAGALRLYNVRPDKNNSPTLQVVQVNPKQ